MKKSAKFDSLFCRWRLFLKTVWAFRLEATLLAFIFPLSATIVEAGRLHDFFESMKKSATEAPTAAPVSETNMTDIQDTSEERDKNDFIPAWANLSQEESQSAPTVAPLCNASIQSPVGANADTLQENARANDAQAAELPQVFEALELPEPSQTPIIPQRNHIMMWDSYGLIPPSWDVAGETDDAYSVKLQENAISTSSTVESILDPSVEMAIDSAVEAIQATGPALGAFQGVECVSLTVLEESWKDSMVNAIQQATHATPSPERLLAVENSEAPRVKRLVAPEKPRRIPVRPKRLESQTGGKATVMPSKKRFNFYVTQESLETMISSGTVQDETETLSLPTENWETNELDKPVVIPESVAIAQITHFEAEEAAKQAELETQRESERLNLFGFGIEDMELFQDETYVEKVMEETISTSESTSTTLRAVCYDALRKRQAETEAMRSETETTLSFSVRQTSYNEAIPPKNEHHENAENTEEEIDENEEVELDFLLVSPEEFETSSVEELRAQADAEVNAKADATINILESETEPQTIPEMEMADKMPDKIAEFPAQIILEPELLPEEPKSEEDFVLILDDESEDTEEAPSAQVAENPNSESETIRQPEVNAANLAEQIADLLVDRIADRIVERATEEVFQKVNAQLAKEKASAPKEEEHIGISFHNENSDNLGTGELDVQEEVETLDSLSSSGKEFTQEQEIKATPGFVKLSGRKKSADSAPEAKSSSEKAGYVKLDGRKKKKVADIQQIETAPTSEQVSRAVIPQAIQSDSQFATESPSKDAKPASSATVHVASTIKEANFQTEANDAPIKDLPLAPCAGVVLNADCNIREIQIENPQICDALELGVQQLAVIGKKVGETRIRIIFSDETVRPVLYRVQVEDSEANSTLLSSWGMQIETMLNQNILGARISVFQFQNRIFVKGFLPGNVDATRVMQAIQNDFIRFQNENPTVKIPGITEKNRKMVLVNMLTLN